jgi:endonuclease/exonuclease/phosphatase (EEP) superfamily protein YafD
MAVVLSNVFTLTLHVVGLLIVVGTLLPLWRTTRWWVRILDFPRFQIAILAIGVVVLLAAKQWPLQWIDAAFLVAISLCAAWQLSWIWRYVPGGPVEVPTAEPGAPTSSCVSFLTTNVYQLCRDSNGLLSIIAKADPDVILTVEADEWWCAQLSDGLGARYSHRLIYPLSTGYGMALFSRFELIDPVVRFVVDEAIPSIKTGVLLPSGVVIDLYGLHPQPPAPHQSSKERDVELVVVGHEIKRNNRPAVVLGDLNDVAWSSTTSKFKVAGDLRDPRRGRGFFNRIHRACRDCAIPSITYFTPAISR